MAAGIPLDTSIQYLKGVGPRRAALFERLGVSTVRDLMGYFPREYDDRRNATMIARMAGGEKVTVQGVVQAADKMSLSQGLSVFKVAFADRSGVAMASFFRKSNPYHRHDVFSTLKSSFVPGAHVWFSGVCEYMFGKKEIRVEDYEIIPAGASPDEPVNFKRILPVYPLTEGLSQKWLRSFLREAIHVHAGEWIDILPPALREKYRFIPASDALKEIHFPTDFTRAEQARQRLAFDEFLLLESALILSKSGAGAVKKPQSYDIKKTLLTPFKEKLRFEFTPAQKKAINELFSDMQEPEPMNRLLMGDVGSGKTVVALSAMLLAVENGCQAALLAPTEILAEQHYLTLRSFLEGLPVTCGLLTGKTSSKKKERARLLKSIEDGDVSIIVGTHALLEKDIRFKCLSLIVIDEQHRFGVLQRAALQSKSAHPDVLLMTATPIPRTLALTVYGDMDVSVIDRLPPGRQKITTVHRMEFEAWELIRREIAAGRQAYIVYPLVEESDKVELKAAVEEATMLSRTVFRDFRVGLLHGQMTAEAKDAAMRTFREGSFDILIATTVIEVGIDVPNATVMVIQHADRFGLSTLHQLRGRVGRGTAPSTCVLLGAPKNDVSKRRIAAMLSTTDGFKLAEEDLAIRGPGEFFGTAQHGMPAFRAANLVTDTRLIEQARALARDTIESDPPLHRPEHAPLAAELRRAFTHRLRLIRI